MARRSRTECGISRFGAEDHQGMSTETIVHRGRRIATLSERLRPGLRVVVVGINPSPVSVEAGHYYQGTLGRRFWERLPRTGLVEKLSPGREDDDAYAAGIGFADILRHPTSNAAAISATELRAALPDLEHRLGQCGCRELLFVFARAWRAAQPLISRGYRLHRMPGPDAASEQVDRALAALRRDLDP